MAEEEREPAAAAPADAIGASGGSDLAALIYKFGAFELNLRISELHHAGARVALAPQSLAVLTHLLAQRDRTVSRPELLREVWSGIQVNEGSLRQAIFELRQALGDDASEPAIIKTVRTKGYRFVAPVEQIILAPVAAAVPALAPAVMLETDPVTPARTTLLGSRAQPRASTPRLNPRPSGLFGRERELTRLLEARAQALTVSGRACLLAGEAGIGKSRLARELLDQSQLADGVLCVEAQAEQAGCAPPFWPWTQLLRAYFEHASPALRKRAEQLVPLALRALATSEQPSQPADAWASEPAQHRFSLFDQLARLFVLLSRELPALLSLEDLHWADEASLAFLGHLAGVLPQSRILLVITCRPLGLSARARENRALARALEALGRAPLNQRIAIEALGVDTILEMLQLDAPGVSPDLAHEIHALTQGNPLFSLELARLATTHRWSGAGALKLPREHAEVLSVIRARIAGLTEPCAQTLSAAAVIGRDFSLAELARLLDEEATQALVQVDACVREGVLVARSEVRFGFAHPLIEKAAYEALPLQERAALHKRHADTLVELRPQRTLACLHELAYHAYHGASAGAAEAAIAFAAECAERALQSAGYESARLSYERALACTELLPGYPVAQKLALELGLAEALRAGGGENATLNALFLELGERAFALSQPELVARAALGFTGQLSTRFVPTRLAVGAERQEIALLERALLGLSADPSELRVLLLCALGYALGYGCDWSRCEGLYRQALSDADQLGLPWLSARVLTFQINVCAAPGTLLQRLAHADRMVALSQEHGLPGYEFEARIARHAIHVCLIAPEAAARDAARATQLAELLDTDHARGRSLVPELWQAFMQGQLDVMERLSQQAGELARDDVHLRNIWMFRSATIAMMRGGPVEDMVDMCERLFDGLNGMIGLRAFLASAYASMRRPDAALQHFDAVAHDDFGALPKGLNWLTEMSFMADAACRLADRPRAQRVYDALLPYASEFTLFGGEVCPGMPLSYWLAELATTLGDFARAEHWLERSDASCKALRADMLLAYSHMARARLLFLSTPATAHEQARAILRGIVGFCEPRQLRWLSQLAQGLESDCLQLRKRLAVAAPPARLRIVAP